MISLDMRHVLEVRVCARRTRFERGEGSESEQQLRDKADGHRHHRHELGAEHRQQQQEVERPDTAERSEACSSISDKRRAGISSAEEAARPNDIFAHP
jgi:hypothetical protein